MLTRVEASGPLDDNPASGREAREVNTWRDDQGRMLARACVSGVQRWIDWLGVGRFSFTPPSRTVTVHRVPCVSDAVLADTFHRQVQPIVLQALGFQALHASAAVVGETVVVFAGHAHSGKSTLAHAMGRAGHPQFADDAVVMNARPDEGDDGAEVVAHAMAFAPRLRDPSRTHFGSFERLAPAERSFSAGTVRRIGAICLLTQSSSASARPVLRRLPAAEGLRLMLAHANGFDAVDLEERRRTLGDYLRIAQAVPVFDLTYRPVFIELPALISTVVATTGAELAGTRG